ncbi:MAG: hypothetical protein ABJC89_09180, partial [Acidobacteriota bacterium]
SSDEDGTTWGSSGEDTPLFDDPTADPRSFDGTAWDSLFGPLAPLTTPVVPALPLPGILGGV